MASVERVDRGQRFVAAKRIIDTTKTLMREEAADPGFDLRGLARR
jgi:hypothetical protein